MVVIAFVLDASSCDFRNPDGLVVVHGVAAVLMSTHLRFQTPLTDRTFPGHLLLEWLDTPAGFMQQPSAHQMFQPLASSFFFVMLDSCNPSSPSTKTLLRRPISVRSACGTFQCFVSSVVVPFRWSPHIVRFVSILPYKMCHGHHQTGRPNVDWCESHRPETVRANVIGTLNLADLCSAKGIHCTIYATGYVSSASMRLEGFLHQNRSGGDASFLLKPGSHDSRWPKGSRV